MGARRERDLDVAVPASRSAGLSAVIHELLDASSVDDVVEVVIGHATEAAGATSGTVSLLSDPETLTLMGMRGGPAERWPRLMRYPVSGATPTAEAVRRRATVVVNGPDQFNRDYPELRYEIPPEATVVCMPLLVSEEVRGVITLSFRRPWIDDDEDAVWLRLLADVTALALDRVEAQRAAADREAKLTFLAEMSARLAGDLDYEPTLTAVAEAAIPWFADWCTIELAEDGALRTIAVAHARPELDETVRRLRTDYPRRANDGAYAVLASGDSVLASDVTEEMLRHVARDDEHYGLIRQLGLTSALVCALKVGDRTFGVITWVSSEGGRRFTAADQAFGESLAQRAAVAIDNAQLHTQVRDAALELQRAVLPARLPDVPGWTSAVRYLPSGRTDAGGDFYDVVPLADGRVAAFVGDVMGRGVQAASVMAQMRSAIRTLVALDPDPAAIAHGLDRIFETLQLDPLVTTVYVLADPDHDTLSVVNAGHPAPLLLGRDGTVEVLEPTSTLILGAGGGVREVRTVDFHPGDGLLLFTDGLVERRDEDLDAGTSRLVAAAAMPAYADPDAWLTDLVATLRDPTRDDDVAAVVLRRDPPPLTTPSPRRHRRGG